jgi:hypothetical protein
MVLKNGHGCAAILLNKAHGARIKSEASIRDLASIVAHWRMIIIEYKFWMTSMEASIFSLINSDFLMLILNTLGWSVDRNKPALAVNNYMALIEFQRNP